MIAPVHLLLGPETGEKEQSLKQIRDALRKESGSDLEMHRFYPFETEKGEIFVALNNNSLFAESRLVTQPCKRAQCLHGRRLQPNRKPSVLRL